MYSHAGDIIAVMSRRWRIELRGRYIMFFRGGTNRGMSFLMTKTERISLVLLVKFRGSEPGSPSALKTDLGS